ncbi:MAG: hypothetical protein IJ386_00135 [Clostridia bacterium]|nr:hypothetical protein [Clostridia bacterium]
MKYSDYLNHIFDEADLLCEKYGVGYRAAEGIYVAMLHEYESDYDTAEPSAKYGDSIEYEREMMSYIIGQTHSKTRASLMERLLRAKADCMLGEGTLDGIISDSEELAREREQTMLSADAVLSVILPRLNGPFGVNLLAPLGDILGKAAADAAYNAPKLMADKLSRQIARAEEELRKEKELQDFINRAPVEKIGGEEELRLQILGQISVTHYDEYSTLTLPFFFTDSNEGLTLTLTYADGTVFVTDGGRTYRELCRRCGADRAMMMAKYFVRIEHEAELDGDCSITVPLRDTQRFIDYLRTLSRIANADLYSSIDDEYYADCAKYSEIFPFPEKGTAAKDFTAELSRCFSVTYDKDLGICFHLPYYFRDEACPMCICAKKEGERVSLTDHGDFDGGRLFERMCYLNEDVTLHREMIEKICQRFRCLWEGETIRLVFENDGASRLPEALFDFIQAASVLGEIGGLILS